MISVVIPALNAAHTIGATLESLVPDRDLIGEIILVDDASVDGTANIALAAARRLGLPLEAMLVDVASPGAARNAGLAKVKGDHVFYLDADDQLIDRGLTLLHQALQRNSGAELAIGASIHRSSRGDKIKLPGDYSSDRLVNAQRYLENKLRSITMGSALVSAAATASVRFPERTMLDEDTCYWAALLTKVSVVTIDAPLLAYNIDEDRMARRFVTEPRKVLLGLSRELDRLACHNIDLQVLQRRKAWLALRIARQLMLRGRYGEAAGMMRVARTRGGLGHRLKVMQYMSRIRAGLRSGDAANPAPRAATSPRTLVLTVDPANPPVSGADLRNFQNAVAAAELGQVRLVSVHPLGGAAPVSRVETHSLSVSGEQRGRPVARRTADIEVRLSRRLLERLLDQVRDFRPDTVLVEGIPLFPLLRHIRPLVPKVILDMHNIESDLAAQIAAGRGRGLFGVLRRSEAESIGALEAAALKMVDRVWICSEDDRQRLLSLVDVNIPVDIVPNGIPRSSAIPASLDALPGHGQGFPVMVFVGHLSYPPNVEASGRLASTILPRVRQSFPTARLILAGRSPAASVEALAQPDLVDVIADPADLSDIFRRGHLSVIPLSCGGGTRIKILEAMAWGLPVVATPLAAEGHGLVEGIEIVAAQSDEEVAQAIIDLCSKPEVLERQRQAARERVMESFGPETIRQAVRDGLGLAEADKD
ncbi:glycosyltransferase [Mesorhizobium sp. 10J20-29]